MGFTKAVKTKQYLRLAIDGISGSGKTYTALATAVGMAKAMKEFAGIEGKIAHIDSEHGSASLYADRFEFDTMELFEFQIEDYVGALDEARKGQYQIVIVDSTSHAWDALVERVDRIAKQKYYGNSFAAWAEGTPLQKKLIEALLTYPGHVIVTCRSKSEYSVEKDEKGKTKITKVGTAAVQRQGFEYEFTMAMSMDANHVGFVTKDRTGKFQDKFIEKPGEKLGEELVAWLNEGENPVIKEEPEEEHDEKNLQEKYTDTMKEIGSVLSSFDEFSMPLFSEAEQNKVRADVKAGLAKRQKPEDKYEYICDVLECLKAELYNKLESQQEPKPEPAAAPAETKANENEEQPFEDDIPGTPPPKTRKGTKPAKGELDIY